MKIVKKFFILLFALCISSQEFLAKSSETHDNESNKKHCTKKIKSTDAKNKSKKSKVNKKSKSNENVSIQAEHNRGGSKHGTAHAGAYHHRNDMSGLNHPDAVAGGAAMHHNNQSNMNSSAAALGAVALGAAAVSNNNQQQSNGALTALQNYCNNNPSASQCSKIA